MNETANRSVRAQKLNLMRDKIITRKINGAEGDSEVGVAPNQLKLTYFILRVTMAL